MKSQTILSLKKPSNKRLRRWRELFEIRVILSKGGQSGFKFLYHMQGYQRQRWVCGKINIQTKTVLVNEIRRWLDEVENEILGTDWEI